MKVVYGNPKTVMAMGMALLGETPTPFIGFVDRAKVDSDPFFATGPDSAAMINKIDAIGGVIIFIENPDAAERLNTHIAELFASACEGDWGDVEQVEIGLQ
jgi:hypothetical protein